MAGGWDGRSSGDSDDDGYVETDPTGRYGRYEDVLGKGAMKTVYRAFDELQGIEVAWNQSRICDVLRSPDALERLYSEVHLLGTLKHDSIISFHSSWVDTGKRTFNFITELFTSGTLREYRQKYRRVDIRAVKNWARQILHGLVYLHSHDPPVIHRDLKCDNIFVNGHLGQVKIGDLGLAAVLKGSQRAHSIIGTPEFMAPELYDEEYNELVDIYSFGMCVLEMLSMDYPYCECSNPAQIYKKVTSGKLPNGFYQIKDPEAKLFIGRCLEHVSKRPSAWELLHDPFLRLEDVEAPSSVESGHRYTFLGHHVSLPASPTVVKRVSADIKITGKMSPDDDTIYLRVQIADKYGSVTNVYFPFDINSDTPIDVANEMLKELEITDCDPSLIACVIDREISALVPHWRDDTTADAYSYNEGDDGFHNYPPSPSSQSSCFSRMQGESVHCQPSYDWLQEMYDDDETISETSTYSGKYTCANYSSGSGYEQELEMSPRGQEVQPSLQCLKSSRFCRRDDMASELSSSDKPHRQCSLFLDSPLPCSKVEKRPTSKSKLSRNKSLVDIRSQSFLDSPLPCTKVDKRPTSKSKLSRNKSLVDVRSQLLHQSLVHELNNRHNKTVGSAESVFHRDPSEVPCLGLYGEKPTRSLLERKCQILECRYFYHRSCPVHL